MKCLYLLVAFSALLSGQTTDSGPRAMQGLVSTVTNPSNGDASDRYWGRITCQTATTNTNPNFADQNCVEYVLNVTNGQNDYGAGTLAKTTFLPTFITGNFYGAGQRFGSGTTINCYGMGDCFDRSVQINYADGVNASGDEGTGYLTSNLAPIGILQLSTVTSVGTPTSCNTTLTQAVTASLTPQAVMVASTTGCALNDYVMVDRVSSFSFMNEEIVQITAVGGGAITGVFRQNHSSGVTVLPPTILNLDNYSKWGQGRWVVDESGASYSTGTIASISANTLTGSGTSWANNMVGGDANLQGCISLTGDTYSLSPFNGTGNHGPLKAWYPIAGIADATHLNVTFFTDAGFGNYQNVSNGVGGGAYEIRPCARALYMPGTSAPSGPVYLENNPFTWTANDTAELAFSVSPVIYGPIYRMAGYVPGTYSGVTINNNGPRAFAYGLSIGATGTGGWTDGLDVSGAKTAIHIVPGATAAISMQAISAGQNSSIKWDGLRLIGPVLDGGGNDTSAIQLCAGSGGGGCFSLPNTNATAAGGVFGLKRTVPANSGSACLPGYWAADANFHYDCIAANTWVRSTAASW